MEIAFQPSAPRSAPSARKINIRLVGLLLLAALPFVYFLKVIIVGVMFHGIVDHGSYVEADLKSLGNFPFAEDRDTIKDVPKEFRALDGKRVMLVGEMYSGVGGGSTLDRFELVYSVQKCCFNGPPRVQERVFAAMPKGKETQYFAGNVRVVGTLRVKDTKDAGRTVSVYTMVVDTIEPV